MRSIAVLRSRLVQGLCAGLWICAAFATPARADHEWQRIPFQAETPHPYPDNNSLEQYELPPLRIRVPGAHSYQIHFCEVDLEPYYDFIEVYAVTRDGKATLVQSITGAYHEIVSKVVQGAEAMVVIHSDESGAGHGYRIDWVQVQRAPKEHPTGPGPNPGQTGYGPGPGHTHGHHDGDDDDDDDDGGGAQVPGPGPQPGPIPAGQPGYLQVLSHVEVLFGVENQLYALPHTLTLGVDEQYLVVIHGLDQFGRPIPVLTSIRSEGFKGNATLKQDSQDTYVLDAGYHTSDNARIDILFPQNRAFNQSVRLRVRPRFEFDYRDSARKINLNVYTGVHRNEVAQVNLYYTLDPRNLTGGEDVTAIVSQKNGPHNTLFLEADHAYPLQKGGPGYFTLVVKKVDGSEVRQTYSIEYKKQNPEPVGE